MINTSVTSKWPFPALEAVKESPQEAGLYAEEAKEEPKSSASQPRKPQEERTSSVAKPVFGSSPPSPSSSLAGKSNIQPLVNQEAPDLSFSSLSLADQPPESPETPDSPFPIPSPRNAHLKTPRVPDSLSPLRFPTRTIGSVHAPRQPRVAPPPRVPTRTKPQEEPLKILFHKRWKVLHDQFYKAHKQPIESAFLEKLEEIRSHHKTSQSTKKTIMDIDHWYAVSPNTGKSFLVVEIPGHSKMTRDEIQCLLTYITRIKGFGNQNNFEIKALELSSSRENVDISIYFEPNHTYNNVDGEEIRRYLHEPNHEPDNEIRELYGIPHLDFQYKLRIFATFIRSPGNPIPQDSQCGPCEEIDPQAE